MEYIAKKEVIRHSDETRIQESPVSQVNSSIENIGLGIFAYSKAISLESRLEKQIADDSGSPIVLDYKFLQSSAPGYIKIGIKCEFRFLGIGNKEIVIEIPSLSLLGTPVYEKSNDVLYNCEEKKESIFGSLFIWFKPTFEDALREVDNTKGVGYNVDEKFHVAYKLAKTDSELVRVLEILINRYGDHEPHLRYHRKHNGEYVYKHAIKPQEDYLCCLPNNYFSNSESANKIISEYNQIFKLLEEQDIDAAWGIFRPYATQDIKLSPFIIKAFPHIQAATHLLNVVFRISRHAEHYGQKKAALRISEQEIILTANKELERARDLLTFNAEQQSFIERNAINPTATLLKYGDNQAKSTPDSQKIAGKNFESMSVYDSIIHKKTEHSYRLPGQYDSIPSTPLLPELPAIEEITEEENHLLACN